MKPDEVLKVWNGPTSVCNRAKILQFAADLESRLRSAQEPFAWVIPGDDNANANGFLDAMCYQHGEFTRPLYTAHVAKPAAQDCVSVPREPTEVMRDAGKEAVLSTLKGTASGIAISVWYAMLAASEPKT